MLIIEVNKTSYEVVIGNRAIANLNSSVGSDNLIKGKIGWNDIVNLYWDGIRNKGKLTKEKLDDYLDGKNGAMIDIMKEVEAFSALAEEAKK